MQTIVNSEKTKLRPNSRYYDAGFGSLVSVSATVGPYLKRRHVDGPLLYLSDCQLHWLTLFERFQLKFGFTTIQKLDEKYSAKPLFVTDIEGNRI